MKVRSTRIDNVSSTRIDNVSLVIRNNTNGEVLVKINAQALNDDGKSMKMICTTNWQFGTKQQVQKITAALRCKLLIHYIKIRGVYLCGAT